jgi:acyl-CoA thioester hydrolase
MNIKTLWQPKTNEADRMAEHVNDIDSYKYKTVIETRFADFDMMGHVNNSVYFTYMEIARVKYWKHAINWDWNKTGVVIGQAALKYIVPIFPEDQIHMYVRTSRIGRSSFDLEYLLVKKKDGKEIVCSKGMTACVAYNNQSKQATPIPERERNKMILFEQLVSAEVSPEV